MGTVLKELENLRLRGCKPAEFQNRMQAVLNKYLPLPRSLTREADFEAVRKGTLARVKTDIVQDVISHYTLRLAYCRPTDRDWFLSQERELLKFRLQIVCSLHCQSNLSQEEPYGGLTTFLQQNNLHFQSISPQKWNKFNPALEETLRSLSNEPLKENLDASHFFEVPFTMVLDLVQKRKVFLNKGLAFVHKSDLTSLVLAEFRYASKPHTSH